MNSSREAVPSKVRLFPDYADTVLWFTEPIDYATAQLSPALTHELSQWEQSYYDGLNRDFEWKSPSLAHRFGAEGERLAQRVADELGDRFEIELLAFVEDVPERKFRASGPALNPHAAKVFNALAIEIKEFEEEVLRAQEATRRGENTEWYAYAPLSNTVYTPQQPTE
ncbi:hypothetical protein [Glutamicibacter sp.]|jgi:hypothetical protein|uniref:hypothetical protein n=1 Tax=Glutamicibacter sp. TaxID=1931995 RepID=UPI002B4835F7|nr:hypothetical protein [Glutamicibacter sp.]HJX78732.1 hypothetical protein [Glutamicibacter sp.]